MNERDKLFLAVMTDSGAAGISMPDVAVEMGKRNPAHAIAQATAFRLRKKWKHKISPTIRGKWAMSSAIQGPVPAKPGKASRTVKLTGVRLEVFDAIRAAGPAGTTTNAVDRALGGKPKRQVNYTFSYLTKNGLITKVGEDAGGLGLYAETPKTKTQTSARASTSSPAAEESPARCGIELKAGKVVVTLPCNSTPEYVAEVAIRLSKTG